ncbi:MAG: type II toxin-antitoxin system VapC family toxin [Chloroflexi bacterium]|jgi:predicted nucleic acid-binding protein|nr:type II toxin-antitoxin system VapC family toxin [Chloroflexota bacterium]
MLKLAATMMILIDTSALLALLSLQDSLHPIARQTWDYFVEEDIPIYANNYLLVEAYALLQNRLGMSAIRDLQKKIVPWLHIEWVSVHQHQEIVDAFLVANRRRLSLVDCASFATMRQLGIHTAFTFDPHFAEQGFDVVPALSPSS